MTRAKLEKLRHEWTILQNRGGVKTREVERLAKALGRQRHKRGREPVWVNPVFPSLRPVSIPSHSVDLNKYTKNSILGDLEADFEHWEISLEEDAQ